MLAGVCVSLCRCVRQSVRLCSSVSSLSAMPSALVILAEGAEEMETVITVDVLRRGGVIVTLAGLAGAAAVTCSRNVVLQPDSSFEDAVKSSYDLVVCPGGALGAKHLAESPEVGFLLKKQEEGGGHIACVCAGPIALNSHGVGKGKTITSHPSVKQILTDGGYKYSEDRVVVDGKLVTSRGPGTCFEFALKLVELLENKEKADSLVPPMLVKL